MTVKLCTITTNGNQLRTASSRATNQDATLFFCRKCLRIMAGVNNNKTKQQPRTPKFLLEIHSNFPTLLRLLHVQKEVKRLEFGKLEMNGHELLSSRWFRHLRSYVIINGSLLVLGLLLHVSMTRLMILQIFVPGGIEILLIVKNWLLLVGVDYATSHRKNIGNAVIAPRGRIEWIAVTLSVIKFSVQESLTYRLSLWCGLIAVPRTYFSSESTIDVILHGYLAFIVVSFVFEILFDFFHYWGHRLLHELPYLYRHFHLTHHKNANPTVYHTFEDTIGGNIMTNCIPHLISLIALVLIQRQPVTHCQHAMLLVYKSFVEISGHSGKDVGSASSFPQCKWLPTMLGIELYTQDHHVHHRNSKINFSKRFSIWDKLFGTFQSSDRDKKI